MNDGVSAIKIHYENFTIPVFICNANKIGWCNEAGEKLIKDLKVANFIVNHAKKGKEGFEICCFEDVNCKIYSKKCEDGMLVEVHENWKTGLVQAKEKNKEAVISLDSVGRNSAHKILNACFAIDEVLEKTEKCCGLKDLDEIVEGTYSFLRTVDLFREYCCLQQKNIQIETVDLFEEINCLCSTINAFKRTSEIPFDWIIPEEKVYCDVDIHKFGFALFHIVCNSYRFTTKENKVKVVAKKNADGFVEISVSDCGIGISKENLEKIFVPFFSYDSLTGDVAGSGLGLTYAKLFATSFGGDLAVKSKVGKNSGTVVSMTIPINSNQGEIELNSKINDYGIGRFDYIVSTMSTELIKN